MFNFSLLLLPFTHILHQALAIRNRSYTSQVRAGGIGENRGFQTRVGGFCLCSRDLQSPDARWNFTYL
jgi:hypothetical protein